RMQHLSHAANRDFNPAIDDVANLIVLVAVLGDDRIAFQKKLAEHHFIGRAHRPAMHACKHLHLFRIAWSNKVTVCHVIPLSERLLIFVCIMSMAIFVVYHMDLCLPTSPRSEERRVGKECRSRRSLYPEKKNYHK